MKNILTIMKRDLSAYFTSPIGYIFMIVFIAISVGLYTTTFFTFPMADMRPFFGNLPIIFCVIIPAITMRVWAEERKENTWEMLLTFPMKARELVIGKFLASFVFLALTMSATLTIPAMLISLGNPDGGAIFSAYLGTLLLGGLFLGIGIFFSGFFRDQILAFVATLLVCFGIFLLGTNFIAAYIDSIVGGLGTMLSELVGLSDHYAAFTRGVIEIADILYFVAWTAVLLLLNIVYIDSRSRAGARVMFGTTVAICLGIGLLGNRLIADTSLGRFDMTEDKIFTVSGASKSILSQIDTTVQVKLYMTPKGEMPTGLTTLEQDITDKLDELRVASGGKLQFSVINLNVSNVIAEQQIESEEEEPEDEEEAVEKRLLDKGIEPFPVQAMSEDAVTNKLIYSSIGVGYKNKKEEIIPQILPQNVEEIEYRLVSTIYKLTREDDPVVALVAPKEAINISPEMRRLYQQMGQQIPDTQDPYELLERLLDIEKYDVQRVELSESSPLPDEYDTLVVINPRSLSERQRWEIGRALASGKSVVMAVQTYEWNYTPGRQGISIDAREETPQVNELLAHYGLGVDEEILMDINHVPLTVQTSSNPLASALGMGQSINLPMHMLVNNNAMDQDTSITSRLSAVFYLWGTAIETDEAKTSELGIEVTPLMSTTNMAWTVPKDDSLTNEAFTSPDIEREPLPLMVLASGQFPDPFAGQERPAWPIPEPTPGQPPIPPQPELGEPAPLELAPGKLVLIGCSEMFRRDFIQASPDNLDLFLNSVDAVTLGDDLVNVRGRKPINRVIDTPASGVRNAWKLVNYGLASTIIALIGVGTALTRRRSRNAYTLAHAMDED